MKITKRQLRRIVKEERAKILKENRFSQRNLEELRTVLETAEIAVLAALASYEDAGDNSALPASLQGVVDAIETAIVTFEDVENEASDRGYEDMTASQSAVDQYSSRTDGLPRERR